LYAVEALTRPVPGNITIAISSSSLPLFIY
jgi:hypothetical protein